MIADEPVVSTTKKSLHDEYEDVSGKMSESAIHSRMTLFEKIGDGESVDDVTKEEAVKESAFYNRRLTLQRKLVKQIETSVDPHLSAESLDLPTDSLSRDTL